jgi:transposase
LLALCGGRGSLGGSFVPPEEIRRLRTRTRYRRRLTQARTAEKQRCEKLLEDAHLKLSSVISDIHGVSGRDMLRAIIAGERNPRVLAEMARGRMRSKTARLQEALDCSFFTEEHAFILPVMLDNIDHYTAQVAVLDERIAVLCEPYQRQVAQLDAIPGFGVTTAQELIAEIGTVMRTQLVIAHGLLSDPEAEYRELGPGYYEETRRHPPPGPQPHIRSLERLGYKVTIEPVDPGTGELTVKAG